MNILLVTHNYAPDTSPRAYRWTAIAEAWADRGFHVDVVTSGRQKDQSPVGQTGVHVHRVGERIIGRLRRGSNNPKLADTHSGTDRTNFENCLKRAARQIYSITWRKILWPDYAWFWYRPALKTAKRLCQSYRYDAIITVSHPFTGHMVGLRLKRAYPALRWITDNGDPFSVGGTVASNTQFLYQRLNRWAENAVLTSCDSISVTVDGCKTLFTEEFAIAPEKCSVVPPLLSLETNKTTGKPPFDKNGSIDLVYLGVLYPEIRRPDTVLALFASLQSRLKNCRLHFIGDVQGCHASFARHPELIGKSVFIHEPVARNRIPAILSASNALINIGNDTPHQLPSKLIEYVASGQLILNFAATKTDTSATFLKDYARALTLVCPDSSPTEGQTEAVLSFLTDPPKLSDDNLENTIGRFRLGPISAAYERLISGTEPHRT